MNLKKALKEKNKLKGKLSETYSRISRYNLSEEGLERPYNPTKLLKELMEHVDEMVQLKTKIQIANTAIYDKIFRLAELKNIASKVKYLSCEREKTSNGYLSDAAITTKERDAFVEKLQKEIEQIQEDLDEFNYHQKI
jgi:hypothetical protein